MTNCLLPMVVLTAERDRNIIIQQIRERRELLEGMQGWLYTRVLNSEVEQLFGKLAELANSKGDFQI